MFWRDSTQIIDHRVLYNFILSILSRDRNNCGAQKADATRAANLLRIFVVKEKPRRMCHEPAALPSFEAASPNKQPTGGRLSAVNIAAATVAAAAGSLVPPTGIVNPSIPWKTRPLGSCRAVN